MSISRLCIYFTFFMSSSAIFNRYFVSFTLQINCVIVPIGQYTHQLRGLNKIIVMKPNIVEVSITL